MSGPWVLGWMGACLAALLGVRSATFLLLESKVSPIQEVAVASKGEKALASVIRELRKGAKRKDKARDVAAAVWPAFCEAVTIAQDEKRTGDIKGVRRSMPSEAMAD